MEKYLTEMLHMDTKLVEATELYDHLPLLFKGTYVIYKVNSGGVEWIALQPNTNVRLSQIRKNRAFLEQKQQMNVAVFLEKASLYSKDKMTEEGIPFVIRNDQIKNSRFLWKLCISNVNCNVRWFFYHWHLPPFHYSSLNTLISQKKSPLTLVSDVSKLLKTCFAIPPSLLFKIYSSTTLIPSMSTRMIDNSSGIIISWHLLTN